MSWLNKVAQFGKRSRQAPHQTILMGKYKVLAFLSRRLAGVRTGWFLSQPCGVCVSRRREKWQEWHASNSLWRQKELEVPQVAGAVGSPGRGNYRRMPKYESSGRYRPKAHGD